LLFFATKAAHKNNYMAHLPASGMKCRAITGDVTIISKAVR
jgi:hypothetical protein